MTYSPYSDSQEPQWELDSPFLNETVFNNEAATQAAQTWATRQAALEMQSPFLEAFEQEQGAMMELEAEEEYEEFEEETFAQQWTGKEDKLESEVVWERPNELNAGEFEEAETFLDELSQEEVKESFWRMRPPVRYQANRYICWAEAISSWSIVTPGVQKFKSGQDVINFFKLLGVVNSDESLQLPKGMDEIQRFFGLNFQKFTGGGSLSAINIVPLLKHSHLIIIFRRPGASYYHFVVVYGIDRFHICFMDPEINPTTPELDKIKKNRVCAKIYDFGAGATEFFVFWKKQKIQKETFTDLLNDEDSEPELKAVNQDYFNELDTVKLEQEIELTETHNLEEENFEQEAINSLKEKVKWYQTILKVVSGFTNLTINGNHNDPNTKQALKQLQKLYHLESTGYLTVAANLALTQIALEWMYRKKIPNQLGKRGQELTSQIKQFQKDYQLTSDGKVGALTRDRMMKVVNQHLPSPLQNYHFILGRADEISSSEFHENELENLAEAEILPDENSDDRVMISRKKTKQPPYQWICTFRVKFPDPDGGRDLTFVGGTGLLISPWHILTAAHIFYAEIDGRKGTRATVMVKSVQVFIGRHLVNEVSQAQAKIIYPLRTEFTANLDIRYDYALIKLDRKVNIGYWGSRRDSETIEILNRNNLENQIAIVCGYPQKVNRPIPFVQTATLVKWTQWLGAGKINHLPPLIMDSQGAFHPDGNIIMYLIDTSNGQSGSPVWCSHPSQEGKKYLVAIHHGGCGDSTKGFSLIQNCFDPVSNTGNFNVGIFINSDVLNQIVRWDSDTFQLIQGKLVVR